MGLHSNGGLLAVFANIRLVRKRMEVANTIAYNDTATITAIKSFIVQGPYSQHFIFIKTYEQAK